MWKDLCCIFLIGFLLSSCSQKDPVATVPSYLYIPEFTIDSSRQSDMELFSHKISDVWVYVDNNNQGAYELPATIPIAESGIHDIELRPGIKNAGIATDRRPYPYYALSLLSNYSTKPGMVDTIKPVTFYDIDPTPITIAWEEGFESLGPSYEIKQGSDTVVTIINRTDYPDIVFKDNRSGAVFMKEPQFQFELISPALNNLPRSNIPIYLEINYKTNHPFTIGLYRNNKSEQIPIYIVKEQENWNKIYLDISGNVQSSNPGSDFNIFIGFQRQQSISNVEMFFDNIKLIHY